MLLRDMLSKGIYGNDIALLRNAIAWMRARGYNAEETYRATHALTGIARPAWDARLRRIDPEQATARRSILAEKP